jgi:hypothetical protein
MELELETETEMAINWNVIGMGGMELKHMLIIWKYGNNMEIWKYGYGNMKILKFSNMEK